VLIDEISPLCSLTLPEGILGNWAQQIPRAMLLWNPIHSHRTRICGAPLLDLPLDSNFHRGNNIRVRNARKILANE
jgi:hypothetical protein